jgi:hypothetical protein
MNSNSSARFSEIKMTTQLRLNVSLTLLALLVMPLNVHAGGGWDPEPDYTSTPIALHKAVVGKWHQGKTGFIPSYPDRTTFKTINLAEWSTVLNLTAEQAEAVIYRQENLDQVHADVAQYVRMVHSQTTLVSELSYWTRKKELENEPKTLRARYKQAIVQTEAFLNQTDAEPLKVRALFIAMRLAHYAGLYELELKLYDRHSKTLRPEQSKSLSEVWYWIDALRAGRLMRVATSPQQRARAAYMFATLFLTSRSKGGEAVQNFTIRTDEEWTLLMALCKDDNERALMHVLRTTKPMGSPLNELLMVSKQYPNAQWTYALLGWCLVDLEHTIATRPKNRSKKQKAELARFRIVLERLNQTQAPLDGFLLGLASIYADDASVGDVGIRKLNDLAARYADDPRAQTLDGVRLVLFLAGQKQLDSAQEDQIGTLLNGYSKHADIKQLRRHVFNHTTTMYRRQKAVAKTIITQHHGTPPVEGLTSEEIELVWSFYSQKPVTKFDVYLNANAWSKVDYRSIKALRYLADQRLEETMALIKSGVHPATQGELGRRLLKQMQYTLAVAVLSAHPTDNSTEPWGRSFDYDPFVTTVGSHNRGSKSRAKAKAWPRLRFAREMLRLKQIINSDPTNAGAQFLYATGVYNTTWFGNSPLITLNSRATGGFPGKRPELTNALNAAKTHYQHAFDATGKRELKVKILYALSKVELTQILINDPPRFIDTKNITKLKAKGFGQYFTQIKDYKNTDYFREVIRACGVYQNFH